MPIAHQVRTVSDSRRDAQRYHKLLLALDGARSEIKNAGVTGQPGLAELIGRLLPGLCEALDAEQAFVAVQSDGDASGEASGPLEVTAAHPRVELCGVRLPWAGIIQRLGEDGKPKVVDSLDGDGGPFIPGLEIFKARAAVLVRTQGVAGTLVVGICNHSLAGSGPYLATDGKALDNVVELVAIGARMGERHRQELRGIQEVSLAVSGVLDLDALLPSISRQAADIFRAPATSVMLWDSREENLVVRAQCGLSAQFVAARRIPRECLAPELAGSGAARPSVTDDLRRHPDGQIELLLREDLCSVLRAPLRVEGRLIGLLNIYSKREPRDFTPEQTELVMIYASQVAIAVNNARLYQAVKRESQHWQALHDASKAISAGFTAQQREVLDRIVQQAVLRICGIDGPQPNSGIIQLYDAVTKELRFESAYPPELLPSLKVRIGQRRSIDPSHAVDGRIGITGRAILAQTSVRVPDVSADRDYVTIDEKTRAELAVPLIDGEQVIGVLSLESSRPAAFDRRDEEALEGLAELAVIAIKNADQADHLSRANAVAMMGAWGADFAHAVNEEVGFIRRAACAVEQQRGLDGEVKRWMGDIDRHAANLSMLELPQQPAPRGQAQEIRDAALLDPVVQAEMESFQRDYPSIAWQCDLACPRLRVAMNEQWLRRLLRLLMHNAVEAIARRKDVRRVALRTRRRGGMAEVQVEDSGSGIAPSVEPLLFRQRIVGPDKRRGQGLLLARFLAEQHGGTVALSWNRPGQGAGFSFSIPLAPHRLRTFRSDAGS